ncbi:hypothetical protein HPP92_027945 [Vanilla planifolia]|uniref:Uncharacterized protein n=1 Tax=Vanilla planifolia TaxID=51239 RepID=A0A835Q8K3_VANPL|nr:hypothetical protein HPP92_027945 [Vanilla planifolia]KAG0466738.1 hypothetical protein HPP92_018318 [Vanilla planifolia]
MDKEDGGFKYKFREVTTGSGSFDRGLRCLNSRPRRMSKNSHVRFLWRMHP